VSGTGSTDNAAFSILDSQLRIFASLDFETKSSYSVRVRSKDQGGLFFEKTFTIAIVDVNEGIYVPTGQQSVAAAIFAGADTLVKQGGGTLILDKANSHTGGTVVESGQVILRHVSGLGVGTLDVRAGAGVTLDVSGANASVGVLSLAGGGLIDFGYGRLTIAASGFSLPLVMNTLRTGYERSWSGTDGFASRNVAAVSGGGLGYVVNDDGSLTVGFAASGDANLDGTTDILDLSAMLASGKFNSSESASWSEGDFNYDQVFDILDISDFLSTSLFNAGTYIPSQSSPAQPQLQATSSSLSVSDAAFMALATESSTTSGSTSVKKRRFAVL
jgi:autotransporter-associated beta strand protein